MKLFFLLLVVASLPANVGTAQSAVTGSPLSEALPGADSGAEREADTPPAAIPVARESSIEFEHAAGRSVLGPGPLTQLELRTVGAQTLIAFGERTWPVAEALFLRFPQRGASSQKKAWIVLFRNGDSLRANIGVPDADDADAGDEDNLRLLAASLGDRTVEVPLGAITALIAETALFGRPGRLRDYPQARAQLIRRLQGMKVDEDVVLLRRSTGSSGPQGARIEGIMETLTNGSLTINSDRLGDVKVSYDRLKALVLAQIEDDEDKGDEDKGDGKPDAPDGLRVQMRLQDGSSLVGRLDALGDARARVHHEFLGAVEVELEHLAEIAFLDGRVTYLSDREPAHVREVPGPLFNGTDRYAYKRDTNVLYGPLRMSGRIFRKGLGVHSYSLLEYALAEDDARFRSTIGLDDSARPFSTAVAAADVASVVFRVKVDGKLLFQKAMSWKDAPLPIEVPIKGDKLSLEVDFGGVAGSMNSTLDRANWADARLVKSPD